MKFMENSVPQVQPTYDVKGSSTLQIEQYPPNKPNFLLVVLLACAVLLVIFVLAYLFVDFEGGHIHIRHRHANPNAQLIRPALDSTAIAG